MTTLRKVREFWTETHRAINEDSVKVTTRCCSLPGDTRRKCADARGNKTQCRCHCHSKEGDKSLDTPFSK